MATDENVSGRPPQTEAQAELLKPAIAELLQTIPETWAEFDSDSLSAVQQTALFLLTAAGMVERRVRFRSEMLDHPTAFDVTFEATGEYGTVEALQAKTAATWETWGETYREWRKRIPEGTPAFRTELLKPQWWRLTAEGIEARQDFARSNTDARPDAVFDFVLKRGFFGPGYLFRIASMRQVSSDEVRHARNRYRAGEDVSRQGRPAVRGAGRLIEFHKIEKPAASQSVNLTNWGEGADAFAAAFGQMLGPYFDAMVKGQQAAGQAVAPPADKTEQSEEDDRADAAKEITELEGKTPPLDRNSGKWVSNKRAAHLEGVETRTLADYRLQGIKSAGGTLGRDRDGRVWRREGTPNSHPWYLRSTLRAK